VDPRSGLDDVEKRKFLTLPGLELRPHGLPARSISGLKFPRQFLVPLPPKFSFSLSGQCKRSHFCKVLLLRTVLMDWIT
jgi:hypothetical protein